MRKLSLILAISSAVISAPVFAQNVTYACQYLESAGLGWKNGRWTVTKFNVGAPFFLKASNSSLDKESVAKVLKKSRASFVLCHQPDEGTQSCGDFLGGSLVFDFNTLNGGVSKIFGSSLPTNDNDKDTLSVQPFTCTKM